MRAAKRSDDKKRVSRDAASRKHADSDAPDSSTIKELPDLYTRRSFTTDSPKDPKDSTDPSKRKLTDPDSQKDLENLPDLYKQRVFGTNKEEDREELPDLYQPKERKRNFWHDIIDLLIAAVLAMLLSFGLRFFVIDMYAVPTGSMEPTIAMGDHILAEKVSIHFKPIVKGEIVFFDDPEIVGRILVKRVIAVSGQEVVIKNGLVYIDGVGTFEPYTHDESTYPLILANATVGIEYPYVVPEGYIWVMGDNRGNSLDSRIFGAVPSNAVLGRAVLRIWPLESFGFLD
ncbi:MAG: signal peptidase I [Coriobacteriia bacterium]|nr:signal peptidase I [Coriobacteriia bacterium]